MRKHRPFAIALLAGLGAACAPPSQAEMRQEATRLAPIGAPGRGAVVSIQRAGFRCGPNYLANFVAADILCERHRSAHVVAGCIQRIFVSLDARKSVRKTDAGISCASF